MSVSRKTSPMWDTVLSYIGVRSRPGRSETEDLQTQVDQAHREWVFAQQYFETVTHPELVDHAIFVQEAARRKYIYLLRRLRAAHGADPTAMARRS